MDFSDESYVRLYVRDTKTWLRLGFEGQCVLMFLLRKLDRAGVLDGIDDPESDVALITGVPIKLVRVGLARLLKSEVFELVGSCLVMPNYIKAQNAVRSDKARQRDARQKRLGTARLVTVRDETSRGQTDAPESSRTVTLLCADPNCTVPSIAAEEPPPPAAPVEAQSPQHVWHNLDGWEIPEEVYTAAEIAGLPRERLEFRVNKLREGPIGGKRGKFSRTKYVLGLIGTWRTWDEEDAAKARGRRPADPTQRIADRVSMLREQEAAEEAAQKGQVT